MPTGPPGDFTLAPPPGLSGTAARPGERSAEDVALVLHTSGTTSRPKIVPLQHVNVTASAYHIGRTLALTPDDVCLNIMPLFHIHGLIAATLSSLAAGASGVVHAGLQRVPLLRAGSTRSGRPGTPRCRPCTRRSWRWPPRNAEAIAQGRLRFIRSSSASLPPQVMTALEAAFGVPVIESYGMTEAAHQMASNPLPPRRGFAGCVGIAAGPEIAIMDEVGTLLPPGGLGEVVIRGRNVTAGYENNPDRQRQRVYQWLVPHRRPGRRSTRMAICG